MAGYWIKFYEEILDDPKMGRLPDRLWRRVSECFLFARRQGEGGFLPRVEDMAWTLRCDASELEGELQELAKRTGIVELRDGRWFVVKFGERQAVASKGAERVRRFREKKKALQETLHETQGETDREEEDIEREGEEEKEAECNDAPAPWSMLSVTPSEDIVEFHERLSGCALNKAQAALLLSGVEALGAEKVCKAIKEWLNRGHKPWNVEGILDVARNGWKNPPGSPRRGGRDGPRAAASGESYLEGPYADIIKH